MYKALLASRLVHFFVVGGVIFALAPKESRRIELSSDVLRAMQSAESAREGHALAEPKRREVDARTIEDELLYREALRLSLDKGDPIVRQRLIQKLLLVAEDLGGASRAPTDAELRAFYDGHRARYLQPEQLHFIHVFASKREALPADAALAPDARTPPALGEAFAQPRDVTATRDQIARDFGGAFGDVLERSNGAWSEPVASKYGWHRARLVERVAPQAVPFAAVRKRLELEVLLDRRQRIVAAYLQRLATSYDLRLDGQPLHGFVPPARLAARVDPSAED